MKRISSGILMSLLVPTLLHGQNLPNRFARPISIDSMHASLALRARGWAAGRDSLAAKESHAVRNGAIAGAVIGVVAGLYGGVRAGETLGCYDYDSCHEQPTENQLLVAGAVAGGLVFGLVGAGLGKVWQWLD
jgi:uncharacterized protein YcfJ